MEFDEPYILLQNKTSLFTQLVEQTNQSTAASLYEVARQAYELRRAKTLSKASRTLRLLTTIAESDDEPEVSGTSAAAHATDQLAQDKDLNQNVPGNAVSPPEKLAASPRSEEGSGITDGAEADLPQIAFSTPEDEPPGSVQASGSPDASEFDRLLDNEVGGDVSSPPQVTFTGEKSAAPEGPGAGGEHDNAEASESDQLIPSEQCAW